MSRRIWSARGRVVALAAVCGSALALVAQDRSPPSSPISPAEQVKPAENRPGTGKPQALVQVRREVPEVVYAVKPKPLSPAVQKGLEYLVKNQQPDGGWNQGGGWRTQEGGGRIEGAKVEDPSDVGNTCFALLALLRAGNTVTEGPYKQAVRKGLLFVLEHVDKADWDSLQLGNVRGTQIQSKIGPYVDLFAANLVLAEFRGKAGDLEERLMNGLEKTMTKIVRNQKQDGTFAGNVGWAPTLSVGIANKGVARAKERGAIVDEKALEKIVAQATASGKPTGSSATPSKRLPADVRSEVGGRAGDDDAGILLYSASQKAGNFQDVVNSLARDAAEARRVLASPTASAADRRQAELTLKRFDELRARNEATQAGLVQNLRDDRFVAGFGSNGGEEFLSFLNISETLVLRGGKEWQEWDSRMIQGLEKAQNSDGSWAGHHCITGRTFCTATALLVLLADRTTFAPEVIREARSQPQPAQSKPAQ
ncbi:MAG: prenyltransferase/squalene oxidase repeat-containing protein [Gemmatales bacterium]|nr:hypothetical protein [Gemmatales bacterium]MCS7159976.1 hypothetical protein [Gemmatales bacterium]MDW8175175.1 prenyltransferase/squalene oxidase repeat-containing protein [Gemmatales bacterium]MDW8224038.1 prenyltransferase/squalene oxidase repeat-containing protein [Gemmatales bacterium]